MNRGKYELNEDFEDRYFKLACNIHLVIFLALFYLGFPHISFITPYIRQLCIDFDVYYSLCLTVRHFFDDCMLYLFLLYSFFGIFCILSFLVLCLVKNFLSNFPIKFFYFSKYNYLVFLGTFIFIILGVFSFSNDLAITTLPLLFIFLIKGQS